MVESEWKDNWVWFQETLLGDLGVGLEGGWTFMSNQQKVSVSYFLFLYRNIYVPCIMHCLINSMYAGSSPVFNQVIPSADHHFYV